MSPDCMKMIEAARVPKTLRPQSFGLWTIRRTRLKDLSPNLSAAMEAVLNVGFDDYTILYRSTISTLQHTEFGEVVMEDSLRELRRHLPIWIAARGSVLVSGLGLGCVVRGLLAKREVEHVTVVEIDPQIVRVVGHEFESNRRVRIICGDALRFRPDRRFNFAWHDLWTEGNEGLQIKHAKLMVRFRRRCGRQGAWDFPRPFRKSLGGLLALL